MFRVENFSIWLAVIIEEDHAQRGRKCPRKANYQDRSDAEATVPFRSLDRVDIKNHMKRDGDAEEALPSD